MLLKVLIVDDEKYIREELKYLIEKNRDIEICGETGDGEEAVFLALEQKPDIVFLDIHLHNGSGMIAARKMLEEKNPPAIVFATAYDKYAIQGFEINAVDYILKPFTEDRVRMAIDRVKNKRSGLEKEKLNTIKENQHSNIGKLCVIRDNKLVLIDSKQIAYIESIQNELYVYTENEVYQCNASLKELEEKLMTNKFIRTHKSFIVNLDYVKEIIPWFHYTYKITIKGRDGIEIPVSRNYLKKFKSVLGI